MHVTGPAPHRRLEALQRCGEALYRARPDLRQAFRGPHGPDYWYWLMWHGADESADVRANLYPIPDRFLRDRVVGEGVSDEAFHRGGLVDWRRLERSLREGGYDFSRSGALLDFGCGCGRTLRFFGLYANTTRLVGADVDGEAVAWCRENIDFADFVRLESAPPAPFPSATFQAVVSFSVFSHLPEAHHLRWLEELHRITAPGAVLVLTTHGEEVIRLILEGRRQETSPSGERLAAAVDRIRADGYGFLPYGTLQFSDVRNQHAFDAWDLDSYGTAFVLEPYIRKRWTQGFDVVAHHTAPDGWQDVVILRRTP